MIIFTHLWGWLDSYFFQQDTAPAHIACEMVEFLNPSSFVTDWHCFIFSHITTMKYHPISSQLTLLQAVFLLHDCWLLLFFILEKKQLRKALICL